MRHNNPDVSKVFFFVCVRVHERSQTKNTVYREKESNSNFKEEKKNIFKTKRDTSCRRHPILYSSILGISI